MDAKRDQQLAKMKGYAALACTFFFIIIYGGSTIYAKTQADAGSLVFPFEKYIPFIPWMVVPYMTSGLFFMWVFFWCETHEQLLVYTKRFAFATLVAGICFVLFPLKNSFIRPQSNSLAVAGFEKFILHFDSPYNQAPSLHVTYAVLFWTVIKTKFNTNVRFGLGIWLILMILATVLVYQHHVIDVLSGLLLAILCIVFIKKPLKFLLPIKIRS